MDKSRVDLTVRVAESATNNDIEWRCTAPPSPELTVRLLPACGEY
jgi:hypothetical protein